MNKEAQKLGRIKSKRKSKTSAENGRKLNDIRARLTIYGHEQMTFKEFAQFKKWIKAIAEDLQTQKRGELSNVFRATLFKGR